MSNHDVPACLYSHRVRRCFRTFYGALRASLYANEPCPGLTDACDPHVRVHARVGEDK